MKLDANALKYLSSDDFRTLVAVELGQRNHELVPVPLIESIAKLKHGNTYRCLKTLLRHHLVHHDNSKYDAFRLTYMGYDYLALRTLTAKGLITELGSQIGVGKESDIYEATDAEGRALIVKLHRLGRTSFRAVKNKRDYLQHRSNYSWLYLSRLAAVKEYAFMKALGERDFPVPDAIECNRHAVLMSRVEGVPLVQVRQLDNPALVFRQCCHLVQQLCDWGLVHCDFNEFNLLIGENETVTCIDFPQMVSTSHPNAQDLFDRDVACILRFFAKKLSYEPDEDYVTLAAIPTFQAASATMSLDKGLQASGYSMEDAAVLQDELGSPYCKVGDQHSCRLLDEVKPMSQGIESQTIAADMLTTQGVCANEHVACDEELGSHATSADGIATVTNSMVQLAAQKVAEERKKQALKSAKAMASRNASKDKHHKSRRSSAQAATSCW